MKKFLRNRLILFLLMGALTPQAHAVSWYKNSNSVRYFAAACAALLAVHHVDRVAEFIVHPEHRQEGALPVGAGGVRESFGKLLAKASKKKQVAGGDGSDVKPYVSIKNEFVIRYNFSKMTHSDVKSYVQFLSQTPEYMFGYISHAGIYAHFASRQVQNDMQYYEIRDLLKGNLIASGYLAD